MQTARVITFPESSPATGAVAPSPDLGWKLLGWVGLILAVVGAQDLLLALVPPQVGNPEWEFGTVTAALNGLPVLTMGLALLVGWAAAHGRIWPLRVLSVTLWLLAVLILAGFTLYALTIPIALQSAPDPIIALGLKKAIAKTSVQAVLYPLAFLAMGIAAFRHTQRA